MKKIVCEMCESTEFIKEDGLFVCQGCGCKYSAEDAKKMMKEFDIENDQVFETQTTSGEPEVEVEDIPIHTADSPNKISVIVKKLGHTDIKITPIINIPVTVMVPGPDSAGGVSVELEVKNLMGKTAKYINIYMTALNAVGDPVVCSIRNESTRCVTFTGPLPAGESQTGTFEQAWYNHSITNAKIEYVHVVYLDDTQEIYEGDEFNNPSIIKTSAEPGEKIAMLTIKRNQTALFNKENKMNRLECIISNGDKFVLGLGQTLTMPIKHGTYTISFEFWGQKLVPEKCKVTPEFTVDGDIFIELIPDAVLGGFKTKIIK